MLGLGSLIVLSYPLTPMKPTKRERALSQFQDVPPFLAVPDSYDVEPLSTAQRAVVSAAKRHGKDIKKIRQATGVCYETVRKTLKLPAVQNYMAKILDKAGATDSKIAARIAEGLDATTQKETFTKAGKLLKGTERPDYTERREAARLALRLKGLDMAPEGEDTGATNQSIYNIVINARQARGFDADPAQAPAPINTTADDATAPQAAEPKPTESPENE